MRFHRFTSPNRGEIWINLDVIGVVEPAGFGVRVQCGGYSYEVASTVQAVLELIRGEDKVEPPISDMVLTPGAKQPARHDVRTAACLAELARLQDEFRKGIPGPMRKWLHEYIETRRRELREGDEGED